MVLGNKIKVLIVDDSLSMRTLFSQMLSMDPGIEVVATAPDPIAAKEMLAKFKPDVMTLDFQMPKMDGLTFLEKVMETTPIPTIIVSSFAQEKSEIALRALSIGAIDIFPKPIFRSNCSTNPIAFELISKVKAAASAKVANLLHKEIIIPKREAIFSPKKPIHQILAIAASTGEQKL